MSNANLVTFVQVSDAARARAFYEGQLGFAFLRNDGYALVFELNGAMLRAGIAASVAPSQQTVLGWEVDDVATAVKELSAAGVTLRRVPGVEHDESLIWTAPDGSQVAWFQDPDGNWPQRLAPRLEARALSPPIVIVPATPFASRRRRGPTRSFLPRPFLGRSSSRRPALTQPSSRRPSSPSFSRRHGMRSS